MSEGKILDAKGLRCPLPVLRAMPVLRAGGRLSYFSS